MGAGKSAFANLLCRKLGTRRVDADAEAKQFMESDESLKKNLARAFGPDVVAGSTINFTALGRIVFSSTVKMRTLNGLVHPPLVRKLRDLVVSSTGSYVLDAALIPLWNIEDWFDRCVWVKATSPLRLERVCAVTRLPKEIVRRRMLIQETLMAEPAGPRWKTVVNEGTFENLACSVAAVLD